MNKFCILPGNNSGLIRTALLERGVWQDVPYFFSKSPQNPLIFS